MLEEEQSRLWPLEFASVNIERAKVKILKDFDILTHNPTGAAQILTGSHNPTSSEDIPVRSADYFMSM